MTLSAVSFCTAFCATDSSRSLCDENALPPLLVDATHATWPVLASVKRIEYDAQGLLISWPPDPVVDTCSHTPLTSDVHVLVSSAGVWVVSVPALSREMTRVASIFFEAMISAICSFEYVCPGKNSVYAWTKCVRFVDSCAKASSACRRRFKSRSFTKTTTELNCRAPSSGDLMAVRLV